MSFSEELRQANLATWDAAVKHRFVEQLWDGSLQPAVMSHYLVQDYQFCDAFVALMGAAVAACDSPPSRITHAKQIGFVANDENTYFETSFDTFLVAEKDYVSPKLTAATSGFVALMNAARESCSYPQILAVLTVAEWLYLDWAAQKRPDPTDPIALGWIDLHRGVDFEKWVDFLRSELDRVGPEAADVQEVRHKFTTAVNLELAFFDSAFEPTP